MTFLVATTSLPAVGLSLNKFFDPSMRKVDDVGNGKNRKQVGAELGQAQLQLELGVFLIRFAALY